MLKRVLLLCVIGFGAFAAHADFVIVQRSEDQTGGSTMMTVRIKADKARVDQVTTNLSTTGTNIIAQTQIRDLRTFDLYVWGHKRKVALKFSVADEVADAKAEVAGKVRPSSPQDSGRTAMLGGYRTEIYNWTNVNGVRMKFWVARSFPNYKKITALLRRAIGPLPVNTVTAGLTTPDFTVLPGMVLETEKDLFATNVLTTTLLSAKEEPVDASAFTIPNDYQVRDFPKEEREATKIQAALKVGNKFPGFVANALNGNPFSLADHKGNVVLIDFWATWCLPCRAEVPNIVATYKKYHNQGFNIIGISLDQDRQKLVDFTGKNNITWPQFFDGQGWENMLAVKYGIRSIPATYLLDGNGVIIARDMRGDTLEKAVARALSKK